MMDRELLLFTLKITSFNGGKQVIGRLEVYLLLTSIKSLSIHINLGEKFIHNFYHFAKFG